MSSSSLEEFYKKRKWGFSARLEEVQKTINVISNLRLLVAAAFLIVVYVAFQNPILFYTLPLLAFAFALLMQRHSHAFDEKVHLQNLVKINEQEEKALKGDYTTLFAGDSFVDPKHPYSHDLDIFGEGSLFQYMNRANTLAGRQLMAHRLCTPLASAEQIRTVQKSAEELSALTDFRQDFQASGMEINEEDSDRKQLQEWLRQPRILEASYYGYVLTVVPAVTLVCVVLAFFIPAIKSVAVLFVLFQWGFLGLHVKRVNAFHANISKKKNVLEKYSRLLRQVQKENFTTPRLNDLSRQASDAHQHVQRLASLVNALDARMNFMMNAVVNSFLLYDLQCVYRLEQWKALHAHNLEKWIDMLGEMEVLSALGTFTFNHVGFCTPSIQEALEIVATELGHPLISAKECVVNDVLLDSNQQVLIVTGANMAGKSTFLRTIGVNLVLALMGAKVCAKEFRCPILGLRTGMRTADSLKDHQSYFYAELNRLKAIIDELRSERPLFILLDEILKGTNSNDKQSGSIALVKQLLPHSCLALIATHDLVLGGLEKEYPDRIRNYCFEALIENDQLSFDYKLKPGMAQKMNATFLMKKMGIIPQ